MRAGRQQHVLTEGNAYLDREFPGLDHLIRATVTSAVPGNPFAAGRRRARCAAPSIHERVTAARLVGSCDDRDRRHHPIGSASIDALPAGRRAAPRPPQDRPISTHCQSRSLAPLLSPPLGIAPGDHDATILLHHPGACGACGATRPTAGASHAHHYGPRQRGDRRSAPQQQRLPRRHHTRYRVQGGRQLRAARAVRPGNRRAGDAAGTPYRIPRHLPPPSCSTAGRQTHDFVLTAAPTQLEGAGRYRPRHRA